MKILTAGASKSENEYSIEDYRAMFEELREGKSLRGFTTYINSSMSHAAWDKYEKNPSALTRRMKSELRAALVAQRVAGVTSLPPTVEEAIKDVDPDATVAVLESEVPKPDGQSEVLDFVVLGSKDDPRWKLLFARPSSPARKRAPVARPVASKEQNERRERIGADWKAVIEAGLVALENG